MANYLGSILGVLLIIVALVYVLQATGGFAAMKKALGCVTDPKASFACAIIDGMVFITGAKQVMGLAERGSAFVKGIGEGKSVAKAAEEAKTAGKVAEEAKELKEAGKAVEEVKGAGVFGKVLNIAEHA